MAGWPGGRVAGGRVAGWPGGRVAGQACAAKEEQVA